MRNMLNTSRTALVMAAAAMACIVMTAPAFAADPDQASIARGGRLYDKWYKVIKAEAPKESHKLYPAENKKYALGASTAFQVVQTQRDVAIAQASEVASLAAYSRSRVQLDLTTAQILGSPGQIQIGRASCRERV